MTDTVIRIENLSKEYQLGTIGHGTLRQDIQSWWAQVRGKEDPNIQIDLTTNWKNSKKSRFLALKDISFDVDRGEVLGIIGSNGAGKSTLLKILSRITAPTTGTIKIKGRIASLLEVGTGFHPELTGRENVYLNGAILGMKKHEIEDKFDEIVKFAEIEKFIDTPVKRYSSGMYVRLAFAVAAHLEPEILIIDEVLAVGDASFQKKCLGKMGEVAKGGRTVLFVSHNMTAIKTLCNRAIEINHGKIVEIGDVHTVVSNYLQKLGSKNILERNWDDLKTAPGNEEVRLIYAGVFNENDTNEINQITVESPLKIIFRFWNIKEGTSLSIGIILYTQENVSVLFTISDPKICPAGIIEGICEIPANFLNDETYSVRIIIGKDTSVPLIDLNDVLSFEVHDIERNIAWLGKWGGVVRPKFRWSLNFNGL